MTSESTDSMHDGSRAEGATTPGVRSPHRAHRGPDRAGDASCEARGLFPVGPAPCMDIDGGSCEHGEATRRASPRNEYPMQGSPREIRCSTRATSARCTSGLIMRADRVAASADIGISVPGTVGQWRQRRNSATRNGGILPDHGHEFRVPGCDAERRRCVERSRDRLTPCRNGSGITGVQVDGEAFDEPNAEPERPRGAAPE